MQHHFSNQPIIVDAPAAVAATIASIIDFVPFEKFSNSKTPGGLSTSTITDSCNLQKVKLCEYC